MLNKLRKSLINKSLILRSTFATIPENCSSYSEMTGGEMIVKKLVENNVEHAWIYTGGAIMPVIDHLPNSSIKYYIPTHEQSGGHSATGYAKSTGKPGVLIVTSGPGLTNAITPITDANNDSTPLIVLSGQVPLTAVGTNAFQECPSVELTKPITKFSYQIKCIEEIPEIIDKAFYIATNGKPGAVHIDLPKCITMKNHNWLNNYKNNIESNIESKNNIENKSKNKKVKYTYNFSKISNLINSSKSPVIIVGQGCNNYYENLRKFSKRANIPVTTTIHAQGVFDETDDLSLEFLGMHGNVCANYAVQNSDLVIVLGSRFDDRTTGSIEKYAPLAFEAYKKKKGGIIHVNINKNEIGNVVKSHYNFNMDCGKFLNKIIPNIKYNYRNTWKKQLTIWKKQYPFSYNILPNDRLNTQEVISTINNYLLENNIKNYFITNGVGNHQMMTCQFIKWKYPKSYIGSGSLGVMGVGLPYAIGCQVGNPDSTVIVIDGDGSFNHTLAELKTMQNNNLPIKIAIMNDRKLSMVKAWEQLFFDENYAATDLHENPDYVKLAESFGVMSIECKNRNELDKSIKDFFEYDDAILCNFIVESDLCLPLVAPGAALDQIIMPHNIKSFNNSEYEPPS